MIKIDKKFKWNDFSVEKVEKKHNINLVAKREGLVEEPCSKSNGSITETEVIGEADKNLQGNTENLREYLSEVEKNQNELSKYLKQNNFQPTVNNLDASLNSYENKKDLEMANIHNNWKIYKEEQDQFRKYHQIGREANFATTSKTIKSLGLIFVLFFIEVVLNGFMLQGALVGGPAEGIAVATSVAFLNCIASGLAGYYIFKKITHLEKNKKILWGFFAFLYTGFIVYLNSCLGAYRSKSEEIFQKQFGSDSIGQTLSSEKIQETLSSVITPWSSEVEFAFVGIILTFVGLLFAFISVLDGFYYNDTYPEYGNVGKKVNNYKKALESTNKHYVKDITVLEDNASKELNNKYIKIKDGLNFWDHNTNIIQKWFVIYVQKIDYTVRGVRHIINEYRSENSIVRKSEDPSFFNEKWDVTQDTKDPKKVFPDIAYHYMTDQEREDKVLKLSDDIDQKFKKAEDQIKVLQKQAIDKQKELHEKYSTY